MRASQKLGWSGLDYCPLPYESSLSILWRLGWRNVLNASQISKICRPNKTVESTIHQSLLSYKWIDKDEFERQTGWNLHSLDESTVISNMGNLISIWFSKRLRICPICAGCGYHSYWFQFLPLKHCPMHQCELVGSCCTCGCNLGPLEFSNVVFDTPYICAKCLNPIAGIEPILLNHLEFREHIYELHRSFKHFQKWAHSSKGRFVPIFMIANQSLLVSHAHDIRWCNSIELLLSISHLLNPLPRECDPPFYSELSFLCWSAKAQPKKSARRSNWGAWNVSSDRSTTIYISTLRIIQSWVIANSCSIAELSAASSPSFQINGIVNVLDWDPKVLAYILFRYLHEKGECWNISDTIEDVQLKDDVSTFANTEIPICQTTCRVTF